MSGGSADAAAASTPMQYLSTRGQAPEVDFPGALLTGLATDGGLYCPDTIPSLQSVTLEGDYVSLAQQVMWPFVAGTIDQQDFGAMVQDSYRSFRHPEVCPVTEIESNHYLLDLTQGPTLAFKDVALQLVGRLLDYELGRQGRRVTVLGATSGDTGSAALESLRGRRNVDVVILHPRGRVSEVQRRQMTTVDAPNVRNLAVVDATFDDCQRLVKDAFSDLAVREEFGLAAVNSINWARVMAQTVYYVWAAHAVTGGITQPVSFSVPTGNFGNVLAGWYAKRMGLAVDQFIVASNRNDVLTRFFATGRLDAHEVIPSLSPSMDIQVSSNFERLLWEKSGRDGAAVAELLGEFSATGRAVVPEEWHGAIIEEFTGGRLDDDETLAEIARMYEQAERIIDPHTAVATGVGRRVRRDPSTPLISLSTADPAKFGDAVQRALGVEPPMPPFLAEVFDRPEYVTEIPASLETVVAEMRDLAHR